MRKEIPINPNWIKYIEKLNNDDKAEFVKWLFTFDFEENFVIPLNKNLRDICLDAIMFWHEIEKEAETNEK